MKIVESTTLFETNSLNTFNSINSFDAIVITKLTNTFKRLVKVNITIVTIKENANNYLIVRKPNTYDFLYVIIEENEFKNYFIKIIEDSLSQILY